MGVSTKTAEGSSPKCKRPGCNNPVPRSDDAGWFRCCSPFCALEMGEDIPLAPTPSFPRIKQEDQNTFDQAQVIMSARVCGPLLLLPLAYNLLSGAQMQWEWGLLWPAAGLAMIAWGYSTKLPKK
jgi:hypothetical protein